MNPEVKVKWIDALRSGRYTQGQMRLQTHDGKFCCLGVLCDILAPKLWTAREEEDDDTGQLTGIFNWKHDGEVENPNRRIQELAGIGAETVTILTVMNDTEGKDFHMIADWIDVSL